VTQAIQCHKWHKSSNEFSSRRLLSTVRSLSPNTFRGKFMYNKHLNAHTLMLCNTWLWVMYPREWELTYPFNRRHKSHLLALLGAHHIFHVSGLRVKVDLTLLRCCISAYDAEQHVTNSLPFGEKSICQLNSPEKPVIQTNIHDVISQVSELFNEQIICFV
jgi:hypothetical protein